MKKINRITTMALVAVMLLSVMAIAFSQVNFKAFADNEYLRSYTELTDEELDALSFRSAVSSKAPQITVFTHGLDGNPGHWSNGISASEAEDDPHKQDFAYESDSMIEQIRQQIVASGQTATMMVASVGTAPELEGTITKEEFKSENASDTNVVLPVDAQNDAGAVSLRCEYANYTYNSDIGINLFRNDNLNYSTDMVDNPNFKQSLSSADISKHIILVFQAENEGYNNDYVYAQLEYILDSISYQYRQLTGELPTYNMIGHSRGGITNMQYALAHPYNVASLFSMGSPYNGSAFGVADLPDGSNFFMKLASYSKNFHYVSEDNSSTLVSDYEPGVLDIRNFDLTNSYRDFWNKNYSVYQHINFRPIGSYVTVGFILQALVEYLSKECGASASLENIIHYVLLGTEVFVGAKSFVTGKAIKARLIGCAIDAIKDILHRGFGISTTNGWLNILGNLRTLPVIYEHLGFSFSPLFTLADDLFIDLNSQIAEGYTGAVVKVRLMDSTNQIEGKKSIDDVGIAHNLETHDSEIIAWRTYRL